MNIYDIRKSKVSSKSENQDDELLSVCVLKNNKKVVVGTQEGTLLIFSWGQWLDCTDRLPGHPSSINSLLPVSEHCIATGADDGIIRVVGIVPNKLLGVVGLHVKGSGIDIGNDEVEDEDKIDSEDDGFPVEKLKLVPGTSWIASSSHDEVVRFWDTEWVTGSNFDEVETCVSDNDGWEDEELVESETEKSKKKKRKRAKRGFELPKESLFTDLD
ncbi:Apoptotic chromatin condensation inducer in the nucleus [Nowakowskiella sp. JEL0078]|nr:Apoptotic chromatin condensation inducer in the nucleus [Nowakowskiella sp. JEL0078]